MRLEKSSTHHASDHRRLGGSIHSVHIQCVGHLGGVRCAGARGAGTRHTGTGACWHRGCSRDPFVKPTCTELWVPDFLRVTSQLKIWKILLKIFSKYGGLSKNILIKSFWGLSWAMRKFYPVSCQNSERYYYKIWHDLTSHPHIYSL